jgi:protoporphyrinogen oxidase
MVKLDGMKKKNIAIIGAGPAGLTAAYLLSRQGYPVTVFEADPVYVGGISRTEKYKGYHFDIGGHRFFSKSSAVEDFWTEILGDEMLERPRSSKIFYKRKFFRYPLLASEALWKMGLWNAAVCLVSYAKAKVSPYPNPKNFEEWVVNQFGRKLYSIFFKTYTEKVWGVPCTEISADWAAQRIKGLSMSSLIRNAILPQNANSQELIKTLIDSFRYPRLGPGQMWETCAAKSREMGATIRMNARVEQLHFHRSQWSVNLSSGESLEGFDQVISSAPLKELVHAVHPRMPQKVLDAAARLSYRDFITVVLILPEKGRFDDNWIYIHDPAVKVGRIQNFKSWSPDMVPDAGMTAYGLEYFCFEGDGLWNSSDAELIELGKNELYQIGLANPEEIRDGHVVRQKKAYPVYDQHYKERVESIKSALDDYPGLQLTGRNGMHKYNNQDHSMMTAMLAVKNIIAGSTVYNLWDVNDDALYQETVTHGEKEFLPGGRLIPTIIDTKKLETL